VVHHRLNSASGSLETEVADEKTVFVGKVTEALYGRMYPAGCFLRHPTLPSINMPGEIRAKPVKAELALPRILSEINDKFQALKTDNNASANTGASDKHNPRADFC